MLFQKQDLAQLDYDPAPTLEKVTCPVLALNVEKDVQVAPKENLVGISHALKTGDNVNLTLKELPNLNHFFQESATSAPTEYAAIEQTFSPVALAEMSDWILKQVKLHRWLIYKASCGGLNQASSLWCRNRASWVKDSGDLITREGSGCCTSIFPFGYLFNFSIDYSTLSSFDRSIWPLELKRLY